MKDARHSGQTPKYAQGPQSSAMGSVSFVQVPVCELYHRGFTSIGNKRNTKPNPALWNAVKGNYRHAKYLENAEDERRGRH